MQKSRTSTSAFFLQYLTLLFLLVVLLCFSQAGLAYPEFVRAYGGSDDTETNAIFFTVPDPIEQHDGRGFVVTGYTRSFGAVGKDLIIARFDIHGNILWARMLSGPYDEEGNDVIQTTDGGFVVAGYTYSCGAGEEDVLLAKFDADGNSLWTKYLGFRNSVLNSRNEYAASIIEDTDGGLVVTGGTTTNIAVSQYDLILTKFDSDGNHIKTEKVYLTGRDHWGYSMVKTDDGGFLVSGGVTMSLSTDIDILLVKFDSDLDYLWAWRFWDDGADDDERAFSIIRTEDGGYALSGIIEESPGNDYGPLYIYKFNSSLAQQWGVKKSGEYTFGSIVEISDDIYRIAGDSSSATSNWLIHSFDRSNPTWWGYISTGGTGEERVGDMVETLNGDLVLTGCTDSWGAGGKDHLLARCDSAGATCIAGMIVGGSVPNYTLQDEQIYPSHGAPYDVQTGPCTLEVILPNLTTTTVCYERMDGIIGCSYTCVPAAGTVPFSTQMTVILSNDYTGQTRRIAGRINVAIASGASYSNWKSGWTNVAGGDSYITSWNQIIPALGSVIGNNVFRLECEDVTPSPYNHPPYPHTGDTDSEVCTVTAYAP